MHEDTGLGGLKKTYGVTAIVFLGVLAFSPLKDVFSEWRHHQREYNRFVQDQPTRIRPVDIKIKQEWKPELDHVDRCVSCHLGLREKALADAPQPFRTHPAVDHDIEEFGCTVCHHGQGRSTKYEDTHVPTPFWDDPLLPLPFVEAGCGGCHREAKVPGAPVLTTGRKLIEENNCTSCHELEGFQKGYTPPLDGIGRKASRAWLTRWLQDPRAVRPETKMPDFLLTDEEAEVLADFLASFGDLPAGASWEPLPPIYEERHEDEAFLDLGKTRFREARCISCHAIDGKGGHLAPELGKIGSKVTAEWLYNFLKNPRRLLHGVEMPQFGFQDSELAAVSAYMMDEFIDWDAPEDTEEEREPAPNFYERGLALFNQYNCAGCHELGDAKVTKNLGPPLSGIGSKKLYELDFGYSDIPRTRYDFILEKLSAPREFRETLRMPQFSFTSEELRAITTALLAQRIEVMPPHFVVTSPPQIEFARQGAVGHLFEKYSCFACHAIDGKGGDIAPDLTRLGSQLQRPWVEEYFAVPYSLRPIQAERMPNLFIQSEEVQIISDYFYSVHLDDEIDAVDVSLGDPEGIERGRILYWEKYGCQSCHQIGSEGGYVGPPLDRSGERLKPGWIVKWLEDPERYRPGTLEPRTGMGIDEARTIAAYLMSLRGSS
jgi:mono/diheme cytochrome c family protein